MRFCENLQLTIGDDSDMDSAYLEGSTYDYGTRNTDIFSAPISWTTYEDYGLLLSGSSYEWLTLVRLLAPTTILDVGCRVRG